LYFRVLYLTTILKIQNAKRLTDDLRCCRNILDEKYQTIIIFLKGSYSHVLPLVIMGTLSVIGGLAALFLPETLWTHLPNTLEEGEDFGSNFKICSCPDERR
jgi:hypothetical protein